MPDCFKQCQPGGLGSKQPSKIGRVASPITFVHEFHAGGASSYHELFDYLCSTNPHLEESEIKTALDFIRQKKSSQNLSSVWQEMSSHNNVSSVERISSPRTPTSVEQTFNFRDIRLGLQDSVEDFIESQIDALIEESQKDPQSREKIKEMLESKLQKLLPPDVVGKQRFVPAVLPKPQIVPTPPPSPVVSSSNVVYQQYSRSPAQPVAQALNTVNAGHKVGSDQTRPLGYDYRNELASQLQKRREEIKARGDHGLVEKLSKPKLVNLQGSSISNIEACGDHSFVEPTHPVKTAPVNALTAMIRRIPPPGTPTISRASTLNSAKFTVNDEEWL